MDLSLSAFDAPRVLHRARRLKTIRGRWAHECWHLPRNSYSVTRGGRGREGIIARDAGWIGKETSFQHRDASSGSRRSARFKRGSESIAISHRHLPPRIFIPISIRNKLARWARGRERGMIGEASPRRRSDNFYRRFARGSLRFDRYAMPPLFSFRYRPSRWQLFIHDKPANHYERTSLCAIPNCVHTCVLQLTHACVRMRAPPRDRPRWAGIAHAHA